MNSNATDHNLVIVKPDCMAEVGNAANEMAKDPCNANSDFIPLTKGEILDLHACLENGDFELPEHLRKQHLP